MPKSDMKNGNVTHWHLGSLASPGDREESASHHVLFTIHKHMKALRVSAAKLVQKLSFGVRRRRFEAKFHDFSKMAWVIPDALGMVPSDLLWFLVMSKMFWC